VCQAGMYGAASYNIWLLDSKRIEDYVRADELRFRFPEDLEKRERDQEVARCREELRQINLKLARQQRVRGFSRGRIDERQGAWSQRAFSADENAHTWVRPDRDEPRAMSVPPEAWPEFLADFAKTVYLGSRPGNQRLAQQGDDGDIKDGSEFCERDFPQYHEEPILDSYQSIVNDVNNGGDHVADIIEIRQTHPEKKSPKKRDHSGFDDNRNFKADREDRKNPLKAFNLNLFIRGELPK